MKILLDVLGGDLAPKAPIEGAKLALKADKELTLVLVGPEKEISSSLNSEEKKRVQIINSEIAVLNTDHPATFFKDKPDSSLAKCFDLLFERKDIDAFVSCGPTGALLTGGVLKIGRIPGIKRPALMATIPTENGGLCRVLDSGANMDPQPEWLLQYAIMANQYLKILGMESPRIGLLNVGAEEGKGDELAKNTYALLKDSGMNFIGNVEGDHVLKGEADILVCDGFSGNVFLKAIEGSAKWVAELFTKAIKRNIFTKFGALFQLKYLKEIKKPFRYSSEACAPLLGVKRIILKGHGKSNGNTIGAVILQASDLSKQGLIEKIQGELK